MFQARSWVTGCYFTHSSAVNTHGLAFFSGRGQKASFQMLSSPPYCGAESPCAHPYSEVLHQHIFMPAHTWVPALALGGFKSWFVSEFYLLPHYLWDFLWAGLQRCSKSKSHLSLSRSTSVTRSCAQLWSWLARFHCSETRTDTFHGLWAWISTLW